VTRYVLFDLETELIQGPLDLERHVPAITIGATLTGEGDLRLWYEQDEGDQATGAMLTRESAQALLRHLEALVDAGYVVVTWNGAGFDFLVLAHASGQREACIRLAWEHVDMMFWLHCQKGFSVSLANAARAVGSGKVEGMDGAEAARLWAAGHYEDVLAYVAQDVRATAAVYEQALQTRSLRWINTRGGLSRADGTLVSVRNAYQLPLPDTSWMRRPPWPREKFVGWMLPH
jgi:hypothetical protein